ncbi:MAG: hypothetical protein JW394_0860 [Nitrospira sp.]|nr:hypothetical protein [Nitrospira sp.]
MTGVQVVILEMHQVHLPNRHRVNFTAIEQLHPVGPGKGCIDAAILIMPADLLTMERHSGLLVQIPDHHATKPRNAFRLQGLHAARVALREVRELVVRHHLARVQELQGVRTNEHRRIGVPLQEVHVVHVLIDDDLHGAQENGTVRRRSQRHPVIGAVGGRVVLRRDDHDPGASFDTFQLPVRFRHLVFDEVLTPAGVQLGEAHVGQVDVGTLSAAPKRVGGVLVAVPGVVRPIPAALCLIRADFANPGVQQRIHATVHSGVAHLADDTEDRHTSAMLEGARSRALHHFDHFRRITLLTEATGSSFTAVPRGNDDHRLSGIGEGRVPGHAQHVVQKTAIELVLPLRFWRQLRRAGIHPFLPALPHQGALQAIGAINTAMEGKSL